MPSKWFIKSIHPWISLCVLFLLQIPFSLETAKCCNGSKEGTLMSAKLLRKTRKSFLCSEPHRLCPLFLQLMEELGCRFSLERNTQGFGVPLGKVGPPDFWIGTETESERAPLHWCGAGEVWKGTHWFILMRWHVITYFILLYFIMIRRNKVCFPYD